VNGNRVRVALSKATEAIVSEEGRVKRQLKNYETVVGRDPKTTFDVPVGAVNDNYGNLNNLINSAKKLSVSKYPLSKIMTLRYGMYALGVLVLLGFVWSFIWPSSGDRYDDSDDAEPVTILNKGIGNDQQLEHIANMVIRDNEWTQDRIRTFLRHWNKSDSKSRKIYAQTAWYQQFAYRLKRKFRHERSSGAFVNHRKGAKQSPLMKLALALGIADPNVDYSVAQPQSAIYKEIAEEVTEEIAKVEEARKISIKNNATVSAKELSNVIQQMPVKLPPPGGASRSADDELKAAISPVITREDVLKVLNKYTTAYEQGDLQKLSSLFGVDDHAEGEQILAQLKQNYQRIFDISDQRQVNFKAPDIYVAEDHATVKTGYNAEIKFKKSKGTQSVTADATVELIKTANNMHIARFELLNKRVNVITPNLKLSSAGYGDRPQQPTPAELQDIVTRFIGAYESGDIKLLASLFTKDAKTNDQINLNGIKQDYESLFNTTNDRQMFIRDLQWTFDGTQAKGSGRLKAIIITDSGTPVYSMEGEIEIIARRVDDKVLITNMYHKERTAAN
jgi:hypothetical protein